MFSFVVELNDVHCKMHGQEIPLNVNVFVSFPTVYEVKLVQYPAFSTFTVFSSFHWKFSCVQKENRLKNSHLSTSSSLRRNIFTRIINLWKIGTKRKCAGGLGQSSGSCLPNLEIWEIRFSSEVVQDGGDFKKNQNFSHSFSLIVSSIVYYAVSGTLEACVPTPSNKTGF